MMVGRYELSAAQWQRIAQLLPGKAGDRGRTGADNRLFVNAVLWVLAIRRAVEDLPERYGKWKTVHKRFTRWAKAGVWERVFELLTADPDNHYLMLDTTLVRAHQQAATGKGGPKDQALGRSRGGLTTKIHLLTDAHGRPLRFILTPGQAHDSTTAAQPCSPVAPRRLIADKAYDNNALRALSQGRGTSGDPFHELSQNRHPA